MKLDEAKQMLHRANDWLSKQIWEKEYDCWCGACYRCAIQTYEKELGLERQRREELEARKTDERTSSATIARLRKELADERQRSAVLVEALRYLLTDVVNGGLAHHGKDCRKVRGREALKKYEEMGK